LAARAQALAAFFMALFVSAGHCCCHELSCRADIVSALDHPNINCLVSLASQQNTRKLI
jgi:hypothetical protein